MRREALLARWVCSLLSPPERRFRYPQGRETALILILPLIGTQIQERSCAPLQGKMALEPANALGNGGYHTGFRRHSIPDQGLDLGPDVRIAIALDVTAGKGAVEPGRSIAFYGRVAVVEAVVA